ncbi:MAG: BadF/BadG/BcrA/BcrD ATPase family protein [Propionicimonas sp.]|nr:BadF/BadG/BcrA/BcrD ATPase family protein [Propionicimonas sp.]
MEVGIDVGGTHTRVVVASGSAVVAESSFATAAWRRGTLFSDPANAVRLLDQVPGRAIGRADVALAVGISGCDTDEQCSRFATWLRDSHPGPVQVVNDAELFGPAMGRGRSINVVAGTGSIVVGRDRDGRIVKVGGHGWILGDPGSAPGLVRHAVIEILRADDDGERPGPLATALMAHYGSPDPVGLAYDFTDDAEITHWGGLCPLVFDAAEAGDPLALTVIEADADALAHDVGRLRRLGVCATDVVLGGGVAVAQPRLANAVIGAVQRQEPDLRVTVLDRSPVTGAVALARQLQRPTVMKE